MPALALLFNAFVWGVSWLPFRQMESRGFHPLWTTAMVYAAVIVVMALLWRRRMAGFGAHRGLWLVGLFAGLTNVGFNWAVSTGDVVRVVLLFYLMPLWLILLAWLLLGERPGWGGAARMLLALAGVVVVLKSPEADWPLPSSLPDWLGVFAGFCFALTNIQLRRTAQATDTQRAMAMFVGCALVAGAAATVATAGGALRLPAPADTGWLGWALLLGAAFVVANLALQYGSLRLPAHAVAVIMLSEVLFATVSSVALGAATLGPRTGIGAALIVAAALGSAFAQRRRARDDVDPSSLLPHP